MLLWHNNRSKQPYAQQLCGGSISYLNRAKMRQQAGAVIQNICPWSVVCWESSGETESCRDIESDCGIAGMFSNDVYLCYCTRLFSTPELGSCYIRLLHAKRYKNVRGVFFFTALPIQGMNVIIKSTHCPKSRRNLLSSDALDAQKASSLCLVHLSLMKLCMYVANTHRGSTLFSTHPLALYENIIIFAVY